MYLFFGLHPADDLLLSRIDYTVSDFRRALFFIYCARGRYFSIRWASVAYAAPGDLLAGEINRLKCLSIIIIICFSQINGACGDGERP